MRLDIPKPPHISEQTFRARTLLNEGRDFGFNKPDQAIVCFKQAKALASDDPTDPTKNTARLYLGAIYKSRHNPEAAENNKWLDFAEAEFRDVLRHDPRDMEIAYAASYLLEIRKLKTPKFGVEN